MHKHLPYTDPLEIPSAGKGQTFRQLLKDLPCDHQDNAGRVSTELLTWFCALRIPTVDRLLTLHTVYAHLTPHEQDLVRHTLVVQLHGHIDFFADHITAHDLGQLYTFRQCLTTALSNTEETPTSPGLFIWLWRELDQLLLTLTTVTPERRQRPRPSSIS